MTIRCISEPADSERYDTWLQSHPSSSLWQSLQWSAYQRALGRETRLYVAEDGGTIVAGALIVIDRTVGGLSTWECPRGPMWTSGQKAVVSDQLDTLIEQIVVDATQDRCVALYMSPPTPLTTDHWPLTTSSRHEQPQATIVLDLRLTDDELLAQMHHKGRYNIKVAQRHGIHVRESKDIDAFYDLLQTTGSRDGFTIGQKRRYSVFLKTLDSAFLLLAYHANTPIGGLLGVRWNTTGIYYYGASSSDHRQLMAPYLLQWEAVQHCREHGCTRYDLLGIDPPGITTSWAGVTDFKRKFGGVVVEYPAEQMILVRPWTYRGLQLKRKIIG